MTSRSASGVAARISAAAGTRKASSASGPARAAPNSSTFCSPMPAIWSTPSVSHGVGQATAATATQRSASRAPSASECGAPPEPPSDTHRSMPSVSSTSSMSCAMSTTSRPGFDVDWP